MPRTDEENVDELLAKYGFGPAGQHQARPNNGNGHGGSPSDQPHAPPLKWLDMSNWDREPVPERKWAIRDRVPAKQAGLFSGEGGAGKSIIELQKNVAHVAGRDWLGSMPEPGPAFYIGAEDDEDELHIRFAAIAKHYDIKFEELIAGGLHILCLLGEDATLCAVGGKSGRMEVTDLYRQLKEAAGDLKPKNISIDTLSRAFAGNEIDRVQVYSFAMHMQNRGIGHDIEPSKSAWHFVRLRHFGLDRLARRLSLPTISHRDQARRRRAARRRSAPA
jgi:AAA domain